MTSLFASSDTTIQVFSSALYKNFLPRRCAEPNRWRANMSSRKSHSGSLCCEGIIFSKASRGVWTSIWDKSGWRFLAYAFFFDTKLPSARSSFWKTCAFKGTLIVTFLLIVFQIRPYSCKWITFWIGQKLKYFQE